MEAQHAALNRRLRGHFNSFGVNGNYHSVMLLVEATKRAWYKWLCRRSQRKRLNWERFTDLLGVVASSSATDHGPDLGLVATSHIDGGAVCGKSRSYGSGEGPGYG